MRKNERAESVASGLKRYFTGKPCKRGHIAERYTLHGGCTECHRNYYKSWSPDKLANVKEKAAIWYRANKEHCREKSRRHQRREAGIPAPLYPAPPACEICRTPPERGYLCIDHCHISGKFRGWLCSACNLGIGNLGDQTDIVRAALNYLERARKRGAAL